MVYFEEKKVQSAKDIACKLICRQNDSVLWVILKTIIFFLCFIQMPHGSNIISTVHDYINKTEQIDFAHTSNLVPKTRKVRKYALYIALQSELLKLSTSFSVYKTIQGGSVKSEIRVVRH